MCGISGALSTTPIPTPLITEMVRRLDHRGPDDSGVYISENSQIQLGHNRLSIIDLSKNNSQPLQSKSRDAVIVFNGEIYNYKSIRNELIARGHDFRTNGDTEVILEGYLEWGIDIFSKLAGMFAVAIWDNRKKRLILARDTFGIKPLYYYLDPNKVLFGSEIKAIFADESISRKLNINTLVDLAGFGFHLSHESTFSEVQQIPPGKLMVIDLQNNRLEINFANHKTLKDVINTATNEPVTTKIVLDSLQNSVSDHLISDAPLAMSLSGGLDSSTVCSIASKINPELLSFTVGYDLKNDETPYARLVSSSLGIRQIVTNTRIDDATSLLSKISWHLEEPLPNIQVFTPYFLSQILKSNNIKVVLLGEGSDEIFGGYPWHFLPMLPINLRTAFNTYSKWRRLSEEKIISIFTPDYRDQIIKRLEFHEEEFISTSNSISGSPLQKFLYFDSTYQLPYSQLLRVDKMLMANSIEGRVPFLYPPLLSRIWNLNDNQRIGFSQKSFPPFEGKLVLRKAMEGRLPKMVTYRRKFGKGGTQNLYDTGIKPLLVKTIYNVQKDNDHKKVRDALYMIDWKNQDLTTIIPAKAQLFLLLLVQVAKFGLLEGFDNNRSVS